MTGKNKIEFEKFYYDLVLSNDKFMEGTLYDIECFPFEMQIGVYLAYLRDKFQVNLCVYPNASGWLWAISNIGGTDLGWSKIGRGNCEYSGTWKTFDDAFKDALSHITKCSFNDYHKSKDFTHCGNYAEYVINLKS